MDQVLMELLESTSSSSSSSDDEIFFKRNEKQYEEMDKRLFGENKMFNTTSFLKDVVIKYSEEEFRKHFRVTRKTAAKITEMFSKSVHHRQKIKCGGRPAISAEEQCLAFLWFSGKKDPYKQVCQLFNISLSSMCRVLNSFMDFLFDISPEMIKFPKSPAEKAEKSQEFERIAGFKNVIGCIDKIDIHIRYTYKKPPGKLRPSSADRQGSNFIWLQGICDAQNKFLDVFTVFKSDVSDSIIYNLSTTFQEIPQICGGQYHILGSSDYPLRDYLLTPYRDGDSLTVQQKLFNKMYYETRNKSGNGLSLLKKRFKQLVHLDFYTVEKSCKFTIACCILHNLCILEGDAWDDNEEPDPIPTTGLKQSNDIEQHINFDGSIESGELKRDLIAKRFH